MSVLIIVYAFRGYEYASGDVVDVMAYAKHIINPDLYRYDFYVSHISAVIPNERFVFSHFLSLFGDALRFMPFVVHLVLTIFFLYGIYLFSSFYIKSDFLKWFLVLVLLGPLYKFNLGGNELFYNMLIPSYAAKVLGLWALIFYKKRLLLWTFLLLLFATFLHQTAGTQLFLIVLASEFLLWLFKGKQKYTGGDIAGFLIYGLIGVSYMFLVAKAVEDAGISTKLYFDIIKFRAAHHFFPQFFPVKSYIVELTLYLSGIFIMIKYRYYDLLRISIVIIAGLMLYLAGVEIFRIKMILNSQWFKTTIWLELFSLIAVFSYLERKILKEYVKRIELPGLITIVFLSLVTGGMMLAGMEYFKQKHHEFFYGMNLTYEEKAGLDIKDKIPESAIIIYPVEFTGFKIYSEKNVYVDFKSTVHRESALVEWYKRIGEVYGIGIEDRKPGKDLFELARENYKHISISKLNGLYKKGVRYMVQYPDVQIDLPLIYDNSYFKVYKLKPSSNDSH